MGNIEKTMTYIDKNVNFEAKLTWKSWLIITITILFLGAIIWISFGDTASAETWTMTAFTKNEQTGTFIEDVWPDVTRTTISSTNYSQIIIEYPEDKTLAWFPAAACHAFNNSSSCYHKYIPSFYEIDQYDNVTVKLECMWCGGKVYSHIEDVQVCLLEDLGISTLTIKDDKIIEPEEKIDDDDTGEKIDDNTEDPGENTDEEYYIIEKYYQNNGSIGTSHRIIIEWSDGSTEYGEWDVHEFAENSNEEIICEICGYVEKITNRE